MTRKKLLINKFTSLLLFLLINVIVFNFSSIYEKSKIVLGFAELNWNEVKKIDIDMDKVLGNKAEVFTFNENIIVNFSNKIQLYNSDGKLQTEKEINSENTELIGMNKSFIVSDFIQGNIIVIDYLGNFIGEINGLGNIDDIVSIKDDMFAIILKSGNLKVFNNSGKEISSIQLPKGEFLNVVASKDEQFILVILLSSDEYNFNSKLITFSMEKNSMIGGINNTDTIVYKAKIFYEDVIVVDYNGIYSYKLDDATNTHSWEYERDGELISFEIDNNGNIIELSNKDEVESILGEGEYHLNGINKDGVSLFDIILEYKYSNISLGYGKILIYNDNKIIVYDSSGKNIANLDVNKSIKNVSWITDSRLVIEYNDLVEILDLKY